MLERCPSKLLEGDCKPILGRIANDAYILKELPYIEVNNPFIVTPYILYCTYNIP